MHHINGWIELFDLDEEDTGEDWRMHEQLYNQKIKALRERVASLNFVGVKAAVTGMNGDFVFTVHAVFPDSCNQLNDVTSLITDTVTAFRQSIGLIYFKDTDNDSTNAYSVMAVKAGKILYRHDPFLTDIQGVVASNVSGTQ